MKQTYIKTLYQSLNHFEKDILQQKKNDFESTQNIRFINLEAYISYLAREVVARKNKGEFVPRSLKEAQAGYH